PSDEHARYILVDVGAARLFLFEDGEIKDSMKAVVGAPETATPMMAAKLRYASVNPYWNLPPDLVQSLIAPRVLAGGLTYLEERGYQVLSDWTEEASLVDPATVDWQAVADGREELRVRQLPGGANAMGNVKFMFPNDFGVYLHDTPDKALFQEANRQFSSGCVRLEDAPRLARWLFGRTLRTGSTPEQRVDVPDPVPVYITYLTAMPEAGGRIAFQADVYNRDAAQMAGGGDRTLAAR
ncbi:MAG TPA: L,D-transpeptidase family protein, partial [Sphingomicrobium sp.]|nr:L,D-transpeptidase family protein [Sphingomicrobium sp.]